MTLVWTRIDHKLIHGQVSVAWVPFLGVETIVISDEDTAGDLWAQKVMTMGLSSEVKSAYFSKPTNLASLLEKLSGQRILLLFKNLAGVFEALSAGLNLKSINLGNQIGLKPEQEVRLADTFFINRHDLATLATLHLAGLEIIVQSVPASKAVHWNPR